MLVDSHGSLRLPSITEKEVLLGIDRDYTAAALKPGGNEEELLNVRHCLIGNTFCCSAVAWLLSRELGRRWPSVAVSAEHCLQVGRSKPA